MYLSSNVHKDGTDAPTLEDEAYNFVGEKENRRQTISQTSSLFRQSKHKRKIRDKNKRYCGQM